MKIIKDKLIKDGFIYLSGNVLMKGMVFIFSIYLAKLLPITDYGVYSLYSSLMAICMYVLTLNIPYGIKQYYLKKENSENFLKDNMVFLCTVVFLLICTLYFIPIYIILNIPKKLYRVLILVSFFYGLLNVFLMIFQGKGESKKFVKVSIFQKSCEISLGVIIIYLLNNNRYMGIPIAQLITSMILIFYFIYLFKNEVFTKNFFCFKNFLRNIKLTLKYSIPLIPYTLSNFVIVHSDKVLINKFLTSSDLSIYALTYNLGMIITILISSFNVSWLPQFFDKLKNKEIQKIEEKIFSIWKWIQLISLVLIFYSGLVLKMLNKNYYMAGEKVLIIIILSNTLIFISIMYSNYYLYETATSKLSINNIIVAIINIILNLYFIPKFGVISAAITTLISYILLIFLNNKGSQKISEIEVISLKKIIKNSKWYIVILIIYILIKYFIILNLYKGLILKIILLTIYILLTKKEKK